MRVSSINRKNIVMTEPTITCPNCKTEIKLTESLAAPLIESLWVIFSAACGGILYFFNSLHHVST